jgi:RNA polymerase sigma factor (sigma-70 family)
MVDLSDGGRRPDRDDPADLLAVAYRELSAMVLGYLRSSGADDPEAVTQDVFLALYPRLDSIRGGAAGLRTLVFSIAHARVVDQHRRRARTPAHYSYDPVRDPRTSPSAEEETVGRERGAEVGQLMEGLAEDQREVLSLRIIAELSLEQTAHIMNRSVGAIKQLQLRALANLRKQLKERSSNE